MDCLKHFFQPPPLIREKKSETVTPANSCGAVANVPIPKDPWCWNIYQPVGIIWKISLGVNVGKYSSTMDPLGMVNVYPLVN